MVYGQGVVPDETPSSEEVARLLEFETLISDLSSRFINVSPGEVDGEIEEALHRVCELLGIDLAVLWQWSAVTPDLIAPTHAYPTLEGLQPPEPLQQEQFPWPDGRSWPAAWSLSRRWTNSRRRPPSTATTALTTASSRI